MATKLPGIPSITSVQDTTVAAILRPMKESIEILGSAVNNTPMASGQTAVSGIGTSTSTTTTTTDLDYTPPPAPTNVQASGAFSSVMVTWNTPGYSNHAYAEVWRSSTNVRGNATLIGFAPGSMYTDAVSVSTTFYYWVRFVSNADVAGPYNSMTGTLGKTSADPTFVLGSLTNAITATQLYSDLSARIDLVDGPATLVNSVAYRLTSYTPTATLQNDYYTKVGTDSAIASATSTFVTSTALSTALGDYTTTAVLQTNYYTKTATDSAISSATSSLVSTTGLATALGDYTTTASLQTNYYTKTDTDTAISNATTTFISSTELSTALGDYTTTASLQANYYTKASGETLEGRYTVKVDLNGYVSGFGLASTANNAAVTSAFSVRADSFYVAPPTDFSQEDQPASATTGQLWFKPSTKVIYRYTGSAWVVFNLALPFVIRTTTTTIGGKTVDPGVYIDSAQITNGSITNAKIANLAVDDATIASVSAGKLTAGNLQVDTYLRSTSYTSGSVGWAINADGTAEFSNITARGTVVATNGSVGGITIGSSSIRSGQTAFNTGSGFYIGADGKFSLGSSGTKYLTWDGSQLQFSGSMQMGNITTATTGAPNAWSLVSISPIISVSCMGWNGTYWLLVDSDRRVYRNSSPTLSSAWVDTGAQLSTSPLTSIFWNGSYWGAINLSGYMFSNPNSDGSGGWSAAYVGGTSMFKCRWAYYRWAAGAFMEVRFTSASSGLFSWYSVSVGSGTNILFSDVNSNNTAWVAVGNKNVIYSTTAYNGSATWASSTLTPSNATFSSVIWTGSVWIAVGSSDNQGLVATNANADASGSWTTKVVDCGPLKDVTHDGYNITACATDGSIITNAGLSGASNWIAQKAGIAYLNSAIWNGSIFAVAGEQGFISKAVRSTIVTGSGTSLNATGSGDMLTGSPSSYLGFDGTALYLNVPFIQTPTYLPANATLVNQGGYNALSPGPVIVPDTTTVTVNGTWVIV